MKNLLILSVFLFFGCNLKDPKNDGVVYKKGHEKKTEYKFTNDSLVQTLAVEWVSRDQFRFSITTTNSKIGCKKNLEGIAANMFPGQDPEMDQDEKGESYPSEQYTYDDKTCQVFIRMAIDKSKVQVAANNCNDADCPFSGLGIFR